MSIFDDIKTGLNQENRERWGVFLRRSFLLPKTVDNKLITLCPTAGYSLEPVVSLQWAKKTYERTKNNGKTKTAR